MSGSIAALLQRLTQGVYVTFRSSSLKRDMTPECLKIAQQQTSRRRTQVSQNDVAGRHPAQS